MVPGKAMWSTPHRVRALVNMALPTTVTELRSFFGAMEFVRTFMPHYPQVSHVLERLTGCLTRREAQRTPVQWTKAAVLAFLKIKHKLIHFAYNYIVDPEGPLFIYADSSLTAIRAALTQEIKGVLLKRDQVRFREVVNTSTERRAEKRIQRTA